MKNNQPQRTNQTDVANATDDKFKATFVAIIEKCKAAGDERSIARMRELWRNYDALTGKARRRYRRTLERRFATFN